MDRENRAIVPNGMFKFHITDLRFAGEDGQPLWETFERLEKDAVTDRVRAECCYISLMEVKTGNRYVWCIPCGEGKEFFQSDPEELAVFYKVLNQLQSNLDSLEAPFLEQLLLNSGNGDE